MNVGPCEKQGAVISVRQITPVNESGGVSGESAVPGDGKRKFDIDDLVCYLTAVHNIGIFIQLCTYDVDAVVVDIRGLGQLVEHNVSRLFSECRVSFRLLFDRP